MSSSRKTGGRRLEKLTWYFTSSGSTKRFVQSLYSIPGCILDICGLTSLDCPSHGWPLVFSYVFCTNRESVFRIHRRNGLPIYLANRGLGEWVMTVIAFIFQSHDDRILICFFRATAFYLSKSRLFLSFNRICLAIFVEFSERPFFENDTPLYS